MQLLYAFFKDHTCAELCLLFIWNCIQEREKKAAQEHYFQLKFSGPEVVTPTTKSINKQKHEQIKFFFLTVMTAKGNNMPSICSYI